MTNWKLALVMCALVGSAACGSSEDNGGGGGAYRGEATLTIGSEVWEFDNFGCAFGHDATQSDRYSFSSSSTGTHSTGARVQMQAEIQDPTTQGRYEGEGVLFTVYINDIEDFENPAVDFESTTEGFGRQGESGMTMITLDGDNVTATGLFDDRLTVGDFTQVAGTLEARCGDQSRR
jgi:hypothetical protein